MAKPLRSRQFPGHPSLGHAFLGHSRTEHPRPRTRPLVTVSIATLLVPTLAFVSASIARPAGAQTRTANPAQSQNDPPRSDSSTAPEPAGETDGPSRPGRGGPSNGNKSNGSGRQGSPNRPLIERAETKVLRMVREHLPELRPMLKRLRADAPVQYRRAIVDLARSARRLETARRRDETLYEIEVEMLQAKTDVNLAVARLKVRDQQADRNALRQAVTRVHQVEQRRAEYEVELLEQRRKRVESQLGDARERLKAKRSDMESAVESKFETLLRRAGRGTND